MTGEGRRLARGSLAQQASQVTGLVAMLAIVTVLARELSLAELGAYGLITSLLGYLLIVQNASASAVVRTIARGDRWAFSNAVALYASAGALTAVLIAAGGLALDPILGLGSDLAGQVRQGGFALAAVTVAGWPLLTYRDALRGEGLFVRAAAIEIAALLTYAGLVLVLALGGADLWLLIGASGTVPLIVGIGSGLGAVSLPYRFRASEVSRSRVGELLSLAGYVSLTEVAAAGIYAADRLILGLFTSAATVALFEGPIRAHNLIRSLNAAVTVTVLPTAARYWGAGDTRRLGELLAQGIRYTLALTVPIAVTGMVLAGPILDVWLGDRFRDGDATMAILLGHWLLNGCSGVLGAILVGCGRARDLATYAGLLAGASVALAFALAPWLGLEGVALATAAPYLALFPLLLKRVLAVVPADTAVLVRRSFAPALFGGVLLAALLGGAYAGLDPDSLGAVAALVIAGPALYWGAFYRWALSPAERALARSLLVRPG